jgi:hypothetical protein
MIALTVNPSTLCYPNLMKITHKFHAMVNACIVGENAADACELGRLVFAAVSLTTHIR